MYFTPLLMDPLEFCSGALKTRMMPLPDHHNTVRWYVHSFKYSTGSGQTDEQIYRDNIMRSMPCIMT